jgi:hypothetical protein
MMIPLFENLKKDAIETCNGEAMGTSEALEFQ